MSIYALSDLHTEFKSNRQLIEDISASRYQADTLIVAGDIAGSLDLLAGTLAQLQLKFARVGFVVGNHELWVNGDGQDSIQKLASVLALCARLGVLTQPTCIEDVWLVPLFSWYESALSSETTQDQQALRGWSDFHQCKWPANIVNPARYFCDLNADYIHRYDRPVISFSHFLPHRDLLPEPDTLAFKGLPFVAGTSRLGRQVQALNSAVHVFGHSHINTDLQIGDTRYVQNALKYPRERKNGRVLLKKVY